MAVKGKSSAARTTRWDVLFTNLTPSLPEMPHVADDMKSLGEKLALARALESQQEDLRSQARQTNAQLQDVLIDGDLIRARLGSTLKGKFGFTDAALVKYGFKPIRKRKSSPTPSGTEETPGTTPPETPSAEPATSGT